MAKQYPYYLFVQNVVQNIQDENGNWVKPVAIPDWSLHCVCREESNGKGTTVRTEDGKAQVYSALVYMPKGTERINAGAEIIVNESVDNSGYVRIKKQVLKFEIGQLNCRLWL